MTPVLNPHSVLPLTFALALLCVLWLIRFRRSTEAHAEIQRLNAAAEETGAHAEALDKFLSLRNAPQELKDFLLSASDALERQKFARALFIELGRGSDSATEASGLEVWGQVQRLATIDKEAYRLFVQALSTGIRAAAFRWTDEQRSDSDTVGPMEPDAVKREVYAAARVALQTA